MGFFLALFSGLCLRSPQGWLLRSLCCSLTPSPCQGSLVQGQCPIQSKFHLGLVLALAEACLTICVDSVHYPVLPRYSTLSFGCNSLSAGYNWFPL